MRKGTFELEEKGDGRKGWGATHFWAGDETAGI